MRQNAYNQRKSKGRALHFGASAIFLLFGCTSQEYLSPCQTVFDPKRFETDAAAESFIQALIPAGADQQCVDRVMSSPEMVEDPRPRENVRIFRERQPRHTSLSLGLNSRIVVITHDNEKVSQVEVN